MMIIYMLAILIAVLNIATTHHILRDDRRLGYEKAAETGLVWILPGMGALISICISLQGPARVREYEKIQKFFHASS